MRYEKTLEILGLTTLESRRIRRGLIKIYKIFKGVEDVDTGIGTVNQRKNNRRHQRYQITRVRNLKPSDIVEADTVNIVKGRFI